MERFTLTKGGREMIERVFGDRLTNIEFLKNDVMAKISPPTYIIEYDDFFRKAVPLFRNLPIFGEKKIKELAEAEIGIRHSTFLFAIAVVILDNLLTLRLISLSRGRP